MKKYNNIRPTGLKGNEKINRMKALMGVSTINENTSNSVVELTKMGPDGKIYGIVRENQKYYIKTTDKKDNLVSEDFKYVGGLKNKTSLEFSSYSKAAKQLNLKFISISESLGKGNKINVLKNDNLLSESFESYSESPKPSQPDTTLGTIADNGVIDEKDDAVSDAVNDTINDAVTEEIELTENEKIIDSLIKEMREEDGFSTSELKISVALNKISQGQKSSEKKKA